MMAQEIIKIDWGVVCGVCGKEFFPRKELWGWRVGNRYFCRYNCMRRYEKAMEAADGSKKRGPGNHLSPEEKEAIALMRKAGETPGDIMRKAGISRVTLNRVLAEARAAEDGEAAPETPAETPAEAPMETLMETPMEDTAEEVTDEAAPPKKPRKAQKAAQKPEVTPARKRRTRRTRQIGEVAEYSLDEESGLLHIRMEEGTYEGSGGMIALRLEIAAAFLEEAAEALAAMT